MSGGLYGAIFSQAQQQHFSGLFGPGGYGPAAASKMLNELLGRQVKQAQDATDPDTLSMLSAIEAAAAGISSSIAAGSANANANNSQGNNNSNDGAGLTLDGSVGGLVNGASGVVSAAKLGFESSPAAVSGVKQPVVADNGHGLVDDGGVIDLDGDSTTPPASELAHHMLRNILQGKKDLLALDQELRATLQASSQGGAGAGRISPDNNNVIGSKNNNNNTIFDVSKISENSNPGNNAVVVNGGELSDSSDAGGGGGGGSTRQKTANPSASATTAMAATNQNGGKGVSLLGDSSAKCDDILLAGGDDRTLSNGGGGVMNPKQEKHDVIDELVASLPDEVDETMPSPASSHGQGGDVIITKQEMDIDDCCLDDKDRDERTPSPGSAGGSGGLIGGQGGRAEPEALNMKRARVENIVSSMRASPAILSQAPQVNGCKKRKLYHPQQHDNSAAERYAAAAAAGLNLGLTLQNFMLSSSAAAAAAAAAASTNSVTDPATTDDDDDLVETITTTPHIHQKRVEKDVLKSQLRSMQEQLAEMQQKYVQLCSRMEQQSDTTQEVADDSSTSDLMEDDLASASDLSPEKSLMPASLSTATTPVKDLPPTSHVTAPVPMAGHLPSMPKGPTIPSDLTSRLNMMRSSASSIAPMSGTDLEGLADVLKTEITASLSNLVDSIVTRFVHQRRFLGKQSEAAAAAAEQLNKDLLMASQLLDRKSPRTKISQAERGAASQSGNGPMLSTTSLNSAPVPGSGPPHPPVAPSGPVRLNGPAGFPAMGALGPMHVPSGGPTHEPIGVGQQQQQQPPPQPPQQQQQPGGTVAGMNSLNMPPHVRPSSSTAMFQPPKAPQNINSVAAAALYNSMNQALGGPPSQVNPFCLPPPEPREHNPEQNEALSLVVTPKKKRHKVTDTRITPRTVSRILAQDGILPSATQFNSQSASTMKGESSAPTECTSPRSSFHGGAPSMLPVSLPTSVAIPNPSLHESQVFSPYSPFFNPHGPHGGPHGPQPSQFHHMKVSSSPPGIKGMFDPRDSPPLPHPPTMLHPALLAAHHGNSPDYGHIKASMDVTDRNSDCTSADISYNGMEPTISFSNMQLIDSSIAANRSLTPVNSSTLTPMHLRKAKLMFFWVRYPSSAVLKMYFPDIKFNKNNTAQLVKWFSNFREFYYIQMEKYARQAVSEGMKNADDIHVSNDSEIYRVLNLHYNRNNHIEVPQNFRYVVEQTLREFFRAIQSGKDTEQSWKKSIYKIISRMDDPVPEYFKSPNFLEQLE
ncbi:homeobox protein prospero/prox-1 [Anopheles sinensis]|uniref:Homeobox protein prospero n=1 Tax=Anopheles sinensis TaxID=74873 RepID=A0A084VTF5_ANOSI|nr:homeobox protein prospero/prox-1 [Anopheles sinensis]